jgi:hypothetical protein
MRPDTIALELMPNINRYKHLLDKLGIQLPHAD